LQRMPSKSGPAFSRSGWARAATATFPVKALSTTTGRASQPGQSRSRQRPRSLCRSAPISSHQLTASAELEIIQAPSRELRAAEALQSRSHSH
jgi:hypothetical protein